MKKFYERRVTKKDRKLVREFLKKFNVRVHFVRTGWSSAVEGTLIEIDFKKTKTVQSLWSCVFHELGHIYCWRNDLYKIYHKEELSDKDFAIYIRKYGLRAERFVENLGKKFMKKYFPKIPYEDCYYDERGVEWYKKWVNRNYPMENE